MYLEKPKTTRNIRLERTFGEYQPNVWKALFQKGVQISFVLEMIENNQCDHNEKDIPPMLFNHIPSLELAGLRNIFPKKKSGNTEHPPTFTKSQIIDIFLKHPQFIDEDYVHIFPNLNKNQELRFFCIYCKNGMWDFKIVNNNKVESYFEGRNDDMPTFFELKG